MNKSFAYLSPHSNQKLFAVTPTQKMSYLELQQQIKQHYHYLITHFKPDSIIALSLKPSLEYLCLLLAIFHARMIALPINPSFPFEQLKYLLQQTSVTCLISNAQLSLHMVPTLPLNQLLETHPKDVESIDLQPLDMTQNTTLILTSGSSSQPKLALHSFGNHYFSALGSEQNIPFRSGDRWLLTLPLYHVGGLAILFRTLLMGGTIVLPDSELSIGQNCKKYDITHASLVTTQLQRIIDKNELSRLKRLKALLLGGSSIPTHMLTTCFRENIKLFTTYGSTEMSSQITTTPHGSQLKQLKTSGKCLPHRQIEIASTGEILVKGPTLFQGYLRNQHLEKPFDSDGWFHTGDIGELDKRGYLNVLGRMDNMFISGGENIQPEEIEHYLNQIPSIIQAIVVPIKHTEFGFRPVAFIQTSNHQLSRQDYCQFLGRFLPKYKIPTDFLPWPEFKQEFKISRHDLKEIATQQLIES